MKKKLYLPVQNHGLTLEEWIKKAKEEPYDPSQPVKVLIANKRKFCSNGMHRVVAYHKNNYTLIPYEVLAEDGEIIPGTNITAKQMVNSVNRSMLWGHEQFFDEQDKLFSYNNIYPGIYDELTKKEKEGIDR